MDFVLNGRGVKVSGVSAQTTLLDYLRSCGLTGAKEGCAEGECGACAVALLRTCGEGSRFSAINSCLTFLGSVAGQEIVTVEGLSQGKHLSEPQRAIAACGGSQCGYCTPGFTVSLFAEYYRPGRTGPCDPHSMGGNLCRCTGYWPLEKAALSLGLPQADAFTRRLAEPAPAFGPSADTGFERPDTIAKCVELLKTNPSAQIVAGATDLAVEANLRDRRWPLLVSVEAIPELKNFFDTVTNVVIGAGLTLSEIEERWTTAPQAMREWFPLFASPLIRNRATLGGSLATASPVGDSAPLLLALNATIHLNSRSIPLHEFFTGYRKTALQPTEIITAIEIPKPFPKHLAFYKVSKRALDDISTVSAAFAWDGGWRIGLGGVAATPLVFSFDASTKVAAVQQRLAGAIQPLSDHRGSAAYRLAIVQSLVEKFWYETKELGAA